MKHTLCFVLLFLTLHTYSQNEIDILRYSTITNFGTARANSLGGAMGSLGGDLSSVSYNPAGIGIFRSTEISFTPSIYAIGNSTIHYGNSEYNSASKLQVDNFGFVSQLEIPANTNWNFINLGLSYNKLQNFRSDEEYQGINPDNSLLDVYYSQVENNGKYDSSNSPNNFPFGADLAWRTYLLDTVSDTYFKAFEKNGQTQTNRIRNYGDLNEFSISIGGNYNNKLYVGASFGINDISFESKSTFKEDIPSNDTTTNLLNYQLTDKLFVDGKGYNLKVGLIYRASDYFRFGTYIHSPTYFFLNEDYSSEMIADFYAGTYSFESYGNYDYRIISPSKIGLNTAILFDKKGLISIDYEYINYSQGRLKSFSNNYDYSLENNAVKTNLKSASTIKAGTEWRYYNLSFRAGYNYYGNPFSKASQNNFIRNTISYGIGYRGKQYYFDTALLNTRNSKRNFYLYDPAITGIQASTISSKITRLSITIGFRF